MHITSARLRNFKAFPDFSVQLQSMNVLVGPNNSGKSTILSAFRALEVAMQLARARKATHLGALGWGYRIEPKNLPLSLENIHTDYNDIETTAEFRVERAGTLTLYFPSDGGCLLIARKKDGQQLRTPGFFKKHFPGRVASVPVLGPVEHKEEFLDPAYVKRSLNTHRASRHFRNYWRQNQEGFDRFRQLLRRTWPGMDIEPPAADMGGLSMMCLEGRVPRELFWAGFGFQVWCQLLTHLRRGAEASLIVIDEPEIYLHPDLQRQLLELLRDLGPDILVATHSTEMMAEAEPTDMLFVDKGQKHAKRLKDPDAAQLAFEAVGSFHNVKLTQLARNRRLLFTEGAKDFRILRRLAKLLGYVELAAGTGLTNVESGGFTVWDRIPSFAWGISKALDESLLLGAVFDRDYRCDEEVSSIEAELRQGLRFATLLRRKEIENYLLVPDALQRAIDKLLREKAKRSGGVTVAPTTAVAQLLEEVTAPMKEDCMAQYIAKRTDYLKTTRRDTATIAAETVRWFNSRWEDIHTRIQIAPGKDTLKALRERLSALHGITLTDAQVLGAMKPSDVPADMVQLVDGIERFRRAEPPDGDRSG